MGGESFGEVASLIAVSTLAGYQATDIRKTVADYISKANRLICDEMEKNNGARSGTTLALLHICEKNAVSYNIGDSRIYFVRRGEVYIMSEDHTEAERMVKVGLLTQKEAKTHKLRNKLTQHLGIFPEEMIIEPYVSETDKLKKGDMFMLCSDGLTDMVSDADLVDILTLKDRDITGIVKTLLEASLANGAKDNVTIILVKVN